MKSTVRLLLLCFLMLALPFQAFASASMRLPAGPTKTPPCHQQMHHETMDHQTMAAAHDGHASHACHDGQAGRHADGKCGACGACCVGAAPGPGLPAAPALAPPRTASIPFRAGHLPSVDPVLPERPPSTLLA